MGSIGKLRLVELPSWLDKVQAVFFNVKGGTVVDLEGSSSKPGTRVIGYHFKHDKNDNQHWILTKDGVDKTWRLKSAATGTFATLPDGKIGTDVVGNPGDPSPLNSWAFYVLDGQDPWTFWIRNPATGHFLDLTEGKPDDVIPIIGWPLNDPLSLNQQWKMRFDFEL